MTDNARLQDLQRRVQKDPASIAFAQLAEEYRRAARFHDAIEVCRAGLAIHPAYLSARVTLGRALIELDQLDDAQRELEQVRESAPENLAAIRGLAEIHRRRGELGEALTEYRAALSLAPNDPDLEHLVLDLSSAKIESDQLDRPDAGSGSVSLQAAIGDMSLERDPGADDAPAAVPAVATVAVDRFVPDQGIADRPGAHASRAAPALDLLQTDVRWAALAADAAAPEARPDESVRQRQRQTLAALEQWLAAIHVARCHAGA